MRRRPDFAAGLAALVAGALLSIALWIFADTFGALAGTLVTVWAVPGVMYLAATRRVNAEISEYNAAAAEEADSGW